MPKRMTETVYVTITELNEEVVDNHIEILPAEFDLSVTKVLESLAFLPLQQQVYMMANLLTISGFEQKEIADALGISYVNYRKHLWKMRNEFKARGVRDV